jgi:hypothetical protein
MTYWKPVLLTIVSMSYAITLYMLGRSDGYNHGHYEGYMSAFAWWSNHHAEERKEEKTRCFNRLIVLGAIPSYAKDLCGLRDLPDGGVE